MITRALFLILIMMLAACSSDTVNSAENTANPLSSPQDNTNAHQNLEPEGKLTYAVKSVDIDLGDFIYAA